MAQPENSDSPSERPAGWVPVIRPTTPVPAECAGGRATLLEPLMQRCQRGKP